MHTSSALLRRGCYLLGIAATAALVGCASGPTTYTASVQSYSSMANVQLPTTYRIQLLPSQISNQDSFAVIENAASNALNNVGLQKAADPTQAHLVVQIDAISVVDPSAPGYNPALYGPPGMYGWGFGHPWAPGPWGAGPWGGPGPYMWTPAVSFPIIHRSVNLVMRNAKTQGIVYETSAQYNDMQSNDPQIWGILFASALNGFPNPPQGVRQVQTVIQPPAATHAATPSASSK